VGEEELRVAAGARAGMYGRGRRRARERVRKRRPSGAPAAAGAGVGEWRRRGGRRRGIRWGWANFKVDKVGWAVFMGLPFYASLLL
jgi:hypothetical protein